MKNSLKVKAFLSAAGFLLVVLLWIVFAPIQIGGNSFYVIVNGNSMEPLFSKGDLVVLRKADNYQTGDIVAYKYPDLGNVFHRIVDIKGDKYFLKGDHNTWVDSYQPEKSEIIAKFWFALKKVGTFVQQVKSPWTIAVLVGILFLIMELVMINSSRKALPSGRKEKKGVSSWLGFQIAGWKEGYYWLMYAIGLIGLVLGIVAFTRPLLKTVNENIAFQQSGAYTYSGFSDQSVYDTQGFSTGDPIFMQLSCNVNIGFRYALTTPEAFSGGGTYHFLAELVGSNGWRRTFELTPETAFDANQFDAKAKLNICSLRDLILSTESLTNVQHLQYRVMLTPNVHINGSFANLSLDQSYSPELSFNIDDQEMYLPQEDLQNENPLKPFSEGYLPSSYITTNTLSIFGLQLPIATARGAGVVLLVLAMLGLAIPYLIFNGSGKTDEKLRAKMLVGSKLVETQVSPVSGQERIVDLITFEDLAQLAENLGAIVFFHQQQLYIDYLVKDNTTMYRYRQPVKLLPSQTDNEFVEEVNRAITNHEFTLFYQPIQSLETGRVNQVEALLRWNHPLKGMIMAGEFLPQAEQNGVIRLIDQWVVESACVQLRKWQENQLEPIVLAINISTEQLKDDTFAADVQDFLLENQVPAGLLSIELSLDQLNFDAVVLNNLKALKKLGVIITVKSVDSSSLEKLHTLDSVDQLKLGYPIVGKVVENEQTGRIAQQIIGEAHKSNIDVIAAGVETNEQMGFLRLNDCDEVQGYLVSHPLSSKDIDTWLKTTQGSRK